MIYPEKKISKKTGKLINALMICSVIIGATLILINKITTPNIDWAGIAISGMIYAWVTVIYSIKRNTNIASHVLLQLLAISFILLYIDYRLGNHGWAIYIGIPSILIVGNITMLILAIISYKNYTKYAMYQLIIVFISVIQIVPTFAGIIKLGILNKISIWVSVLNLAISLVLSYKDFWKILECKFHM